MNNLRIFPSDNRQADTRAVVGIAVAYQIDPEKTLKNLDDEQFSALVRTAMSKTAVQRIGGWAGTVIFSLSCTAVILALFAVIRWLWPYATGGR
jgi:hypothetical protein